MRHRLHPIGVAGVVWGEVSQLRGDSIFERDIIVRREYGGIQCVAYSRHAAPYVMLSCASRSGGIFLASRRLYGLGYHLLPWPTFFTGTGGDGWGKDEGHVSDKDGQDVRTGFYMDHNHAAPSSPSNPHGVASCNSTRELSRR